MYCEIMYQNLLLCHDVYPNIECMCLDVVKSLD